MNDFRYRLKITYADYTDEPLPAERVREVLLPSWSDVLEALNSADLKGDVERVKVTLEVMLEGEQESQLLDLISEMGNDEDE